MSQKGNATLNLNVELMGDLVTFCNSTQKALDEQSNTILSVINYFESDENCKGGVAAQIREAVKDVRENIVKSQSKFQVFGSRVSKLAEMLGATESVVVKTVEQSQADLKKTLQKMQAIGQ